MLWIVSVVGALVVGGLLFLVGNGMRGATNRVGDPDDSTRATGKLLSFLAPVLFVIWAGGHTMMAMVHAVPAGNVGVVYTFGAITGQVSEGLQFVAPWKSVQNANVQIETHVFERLDSFSKESQDVFVKATLNIRVSPATIQELYRSTGPDYFKKLVASRVAQNFKDETVKYNSVDIAPNRENIRRQVRDRLERELSPYSIEVVDLLLDNVDFRSEFKQAIEAKQIATQRALEEEQKVFIEKHRAAQAVARATGEGDAILAIAKKQAEANVELSKSLTPELVHYAMIQKLSDKIHLMVLPPGQSFILGPDTMKVLEDKSSPK